jgi:hypothetical protein
MFTTCADEGVAEMSSAAATAAPHNSRFMSEFSFRCDRQSLRFSTIRTSRDPRQVNSLAERRIEALTALETRFRNAPSLLA